MSGIYINMEMPKDGAFVELLIWSDGHVTKTGDSFLAEDGKHYYTPCEWEYFSAIPVPEHGDLIDRDALEKDIDEYIGGEESRSRFHHWVQVQSVVIPGNNGAET